jgi:dTDP-4-amino-4,6-dideoxy-D-galactose acyltransferase
VSTLEPLAWDSEFFGFGIGRLHPDAEGEGAANLAEVEDEARRLGIECLYATLDPIHTDLSIALQRQGFRLVEVAMDLVHPTSVIGHLPETLAATRDGTPDDLPALEDEIAVMAPWSRFAVDRRFGLDAARRMHRAWVTRAATAEHRRLVVAEDERGITGFSTQSTLPGEDPRVDLIASSKAGSGAAYALIDHQFRQFGAGRSRGGPVAARNATSMHFVENCGYRVKSARYLYHRWLDEASPA